MVGLILRVKNASNSYNLAEYLPLGTKGNSFSSYSERCGLKDTISCSTRPSPIMSSGLPCFLGIKTDPRRFGNNGEHDSKSKFSCDICPTSSIKVSSDYIVSIVSRAVKPFSMKASFSMCWFGMSLGVYPIWLSDLCNRIAFVSTYLCTIFMSCIFFNP